jgi:predicted Fe-S protein YdhL (DUF1289 family)
MISPCVRICTIDDDKRFCVGCGRTLEEIGRWTSYSEAERRQIMDLLPARLAAMRPESPSRGA